MDRREAIQQIGLLLGGTVISAELLSSCTSTVNDASSLVGSEHIPLLNEIGETILPTTEKSPGAKAADVGSFMLLMIQDCYRPENQEAFFAGIGKIDQASNNKYSKGFMQLDAAQREELLIELDEEQEAYMKKKKHDEPPHYFRMMKELTLLGFFTSEVGATKALRYVPIPGRYEGEIPYKKGDRAWA